MADFSKGQCRFLRKLQRRLPACDSDNQNAELFVLNYISFESQARKVWQYYRCRNKSRTESKAGIPILELENALKYFDIKLDSEILKLLLDSNRGTRGKKSARNLRNGMFHQWREKDCGEASQRYEEFSHAFDVFQQALKLRS
jgi:hypothetical protein